ncbi:uncharacterized protein N7484_005935 [Penicillium longicatenatum]|uniref:uncharacterized protein n=1 Tax=Penicillium longicatenatum TaxID=1561947 RepID=UPI0025482906|nr:uncharacterized protein N7484_005935 [Penicillium longicatenatum]KAJ5643428.1 hypothetical protein N7484_005935 [Penicillium longicatenatum]KAJ5645175.1 hypothetical protein N7507_011186 [Penicillium longicatenatum]
MQLLGLAAVSATAMLSMVQYAPAPFLLLTEAAVETAGAVAAADGSLGGAVLGGAASASVAHGISSSTRRSPIDLPAGVSQHSWDLCKGELDGAHVKFSGTTNLRLDGLPAACMDLATVLTGDPTQDGGPVPTPMGSAAIQYSDLTDDEWHQVYNALKEHGYTSTS